MKSISHPVVRVVGLVVATTSLAFAQESAKPEKSEIEALRQQVEDLTRIVHELQQKSQETPPPAPVPKPEPTPLTSVVPDVNPPTYQTDSKAATTPRSLVPEADFAADLQSDPLPEPKRSDSSIFNPEISLAIDTIGSYASRENNTNLTVRDIEVMIQANVDQVAHAYAVFNAESELDPFEKTNVFDEASLGVEEAAVETTNLPYGLAVKAGQFFADFTRLGKVHSHELPFTDRPTSLEAILGGETKARGVELSWIPPINHYIRFTAGAVDNIGAETPVTAGLATLDGENNDLFASSSNRAFGDITYYGRAATIFELGDSMTLNLGADYAHGTDYGTRQLASADFKLTWIPDASSFDRLEVGGEILHGKSDGDFAPDAIFAGSPTHGSSSSDGAYIYAQYRIGKQWEPGFRYDWFRPEVWSETDSNSTGIADGLARSTYTQNSLSAYLTYHFDEFNRLRFEVSYLDGDSGAFDGHDSDWVGFLQWTITLGPHKHSFQP